MTVFLNGGFVSRDEARVSAFDAGMTHGVGLFETMLGVRDEREPEGVRVVQLAEHLERLGASAKKTGLSEDLRADRLGEAVLECVRRFFEEEAGRIGAERARVRLTVTGGDLNLLETTGRRAEHTPTVLMSATGATRYPDEMFERGVLLTIADAKANPLDPLAGHKTLNYWWRLRELQAAGAKGAGEALVLQVTNHVAGGAVSNVFVVKDGGLVTPVAQGEEEAGALPSPVLPGVTRRGVLEFAEELGLPARRRLVTVEDVLDADEVFLTNSSWGVLPVTRVERKEIGGGTVGEVTRRVRERWLEMAQG